MKKPLVVILAGGIGKRFAPFSLHKSLFPFLGKPFLQHLLEIIQQAGFEQVLITTNTETDAWIHQYKSTTPLQISTIIQPEPLGMGDALLRLEQHIHEPILVMNANDLIDPSFFATMLEKAQDSYAFIVAKRMTEYFPGGYLETDGNRVTNIIEKPSEGSEPSDLVNLVFHYFSTPQEFIQILKDIHVESDDQYEQALARLMKEKEVSFIPYEGYWKKLNYCHTVLGMTDIFLNYFVKKNTASSAYISPKATVEGEVYIDENARIEDFAVVKGPAYIGRNVIIGNHALVRNSLIEEKTIVGFGSEIARSYVGPRCMLHHNFIGDSILESDINPSWGTTMANLRIDGKTIKVKLPDKTLETDRTKLGSIIAKGVFCGVNCSIMPGITIGENTKIHPNLTVKTAIPANTIVKE